MTREEAVTILNNNYYCLEHFKPSQTCAECRKERLARWAETVKQRDKQLSEAIALLKGAQ